MKYDFRNKDYCDLYSKAVDKDDFQKEYNAYFEAELAKNRALPEGLRVGKLFSIVVADGNSYYEVIKVNKTTVRIKNRIDLCPDEYLAPFLGYGGSFPKHMIEPYVVSQERMARLFIKK